MQINGKWVGWGPNDVSPTVTAIKVFLKRKFRWVREFQPTLDDSPVYDEDLTVIVGQMQGNYGIPVTGVMDYATQVRCGFYKPALPAGPEKRPIFFTVEGHMANMFIGPCAFIAQDLENEHLVWHQPVGYNNTKLPFDNESGVQELLTLMRSHVLPNGRSFAPGTPWGISGFSQGGIVVCQFMMRYVLPQDGELHWRLKDFVGAVLYGNPYRAKNVIADWVPDKPKAGTFGIADEHLDPREWFLPAGHKLAGQSLSLVWREHSRKGDVYAEIPDDEVGMNITSIYRIVSNNSWVGGPTAVFSRLQDFLTLPDDILPLAWSIIKFLMFGINMGPHGVYDLTPPRNFMRDRFRA